MWIWRWIFRDIQRQHHSSAGHAHWSSAGSEPSAIYKSIFWAIFSYELVPKCGWFKINFKNLSLQALNASTCTYCSFTLYINCGFFFVLYLHRIGPAIRKLYEVKILFFIVIDNEYFSQIDTFSQSSTCSSCRSKNKLNIIPSRLVQRFHQQALVWEPPVRFPGHLPDQHWAGPAGAHQRGAVRLRVLHLQGRLQVLQAPLLANICSNVANSVF